MPYIIEKITPPYDASEVPGEGENDMWLANIGYVQNSKEICSVDILMKHEDCIEVRAPTENQIKLMAKTIVDALNDNIDNLRYSAEFDAILEELNGLK